MPDPYAHLTETELLDLVDEAVNRIKTPEAVRYAERLMIEIGRRRAERRRRPGRLARYLFGRL